MTLLIGILLSVLQPFFLALEQNTLKSDFVVTISETATQPLSYTGSFVLRGERFTLNMMQIEAAYDGKTLYMYSPETDELQLTEPTGEELSQANPLVFAKLVAKECETLERDKGEQVLLVLVPRDKTKTNGIGRIELLLQKPKGSETRYLPVSVEMKEGKRTTTLRLNNAAYITTTPSFKIDKPGAFINDLR
ncbi:MAG: hypothetical protein J6T85_05330 [Paludibacteraceae bacterium]|nr:hypothetical protein [Paludibacteraceae bacterium]